MFVRLYTTDKHEVIHVMHSDEDDQVRELTDQFIGAESIWRFKDSINLWVGMIYASYNVDSMFETFFGGEVAFLIFLIFVLVLQI